MNYKNEIGSYSLTPISGCYQVVVSHYAYIKPEFRGKGLGQIQHQERLLNAKGRGHDVIMATVREDNEIEKHILIKNGWRKVWEFTSTDSCDDGHNVGIWMRNLNDNETNSDA